MAYVKIGLMIVGFTLFTLILEGCGAPLYKGPTSDHFDGRRFYNAEPDDHTFGAI